MQWADLDGERIEARPKTAATCPCCGGEVLSKCGRLVTWHWAHKAKDCDPWSEPESEWHKGWKNRFPKEWQERVIGNHRADVLTPKGVIEFQNSQISGTEIAEREKFYGKMVWLINAADFVLPLDHEGYQNEWMYYSKKNNIAPDLFDLLYPDIREAHSKHMQEWIDARKKQKPRLRWMWPHKSWKLSTKTLVFDNCQTAAEDEVLIVKSISWLKPCIVNYKPMKKIDFIKQCSKVA